MKHRPAILNCSEAAAPAGAQTPRRRLRFWLKLLLALPVLAGVGVLLLWAALPLVPLPQALFAPENQQVEFLDRRDRPLRAVPPAGGPFRQKVAYGEMPPALVQATLAAEDRRFWEHPGVDWRASLRAAGQLVRHRRIISGASTITQQLVKLSQPRPRTFCNKVIEAVQALRLEQLWDKQRILAEYLNRVEYGNFNTGCAAAARFYFAKPLGDLSLAECAFLAGLPQAPTRLNPHRHFERARKRQQWILESLHQAGWFSEEEVSRARQEPLCLARPQRVFEAPHFINLLLQQQESLAPVGAFGVAARRVRTSLDLELNRFAEETLRLQLSRLAFRNVHNGAVVILDNASGEVLALVGSEDYFAPEVGQVNGAWASRSPGSTLKPFTYLLALEQGATPATVVADVPTDFPTATGLFMPVNFNRHCSGPVRYREALANSLNIPALKVLATAGGPEALRRKLWDCGLSTLSEPAGHYGLGLTLGNAEVRLLELANAYACLARLGEFKPYSLSLSAEAAREVARHARRVADPDAAYLIADILSDNAARTAAFGAESSLRFSFPVACKTGTSSDFRDNWAFGYTPEFTVGVWVGNFDNSPMQNVSGVSGAAPVLHRLLEHLHARYGTSWYTAPGKITQAWVHPLTGKRLQPGNTAAERARGAVREKFVGTKLPPWESAEDYDATGRVRLGGEYRDWLASADNWLGGKVILAEAASSPHVIFPLPGTTFYLDPDLPQEGRRVRLQADGPAALQWSSDSLQCRQEGEHTIALLQEGEHRLVARDPRTGLEASTWISVLRR